jgi:DNA invertase Pin-like site-specific DNA recombinase
MSTKPKRAALYARVSTDGQTVENQLRELQAVAERHEWEIVATYTDEGISGAKGRSQRPALDELCKAVNRKEFDIVAVWSVDRLGRSLQDLVSILGELHSKGIHLYLLQQGIDTTTPSGKAMFQMMGVFAEFERAMIQERVKAGLQRAKAQGKRLGRAPIDDTKRQRILELRAKGWGIRKIASELRTGVGTVSKFLKEKVG